MSQSLSLGKEREKRNTDCVNCVVVKKTTNFVHVSIFFVLSQIITKCVKQFSLSHMKFTPEREKNKVEEESDFSWPDESLFVQRI